MNQVQSSAKQIGQTKTDTVLNIWSKKKKSTREGQKARNVWHAKKEEDGVWWKAIKQSVSERRWADEVETFRTSLFVDVKKMEEDGRGENNEGQLKVVFVWDSRI